MGVSDLAAAERFYGEVIGLDLLDERPFALVHDTSEAQLRITAVDAVRAAGYTVLGWIVTDLEAEMDRLAAAGVTFNRYDDMGQDARGIWTRTRWRPCGLVPGSGRQHPLSAVLTNSRPRIHAVPGGGVVSRCAGRMVVTPVRV